MRPIILAVVISFLATTSVHAESFEDAKVGPLTKLDTKTGQWRAQSGHAEITRHTARTGRQALRIFGGTERTVEFTPSTDRSSGGVLSFWAERWTRRDPFKFRIDRLSGGKWIALYNGDTAMRVGGFHTLVRIDLAGKAADKFRFVCTAPAGSGVLIDDINLAPAAPMSVASVTVAQAATPILVRNRYNPALEVRINVAGNLGALAITQLQINTNGSDDLDDIDSIEVLSNATGQKVDWRSAETWAPKAPKLGEPQKAAAKLTFSGSVPLKQGVNSLWVSIKLKDRADIDHRVAAACQAVIVTGKDGAKTHRPKSQVKPVAQRLGVALRKGGDDNVKTYRIPGLETTNKGTLIGVYDVRYRGWGDLPGDIDVGMSRSTDGGKTWEKMKIIMDTGSDKKWRYDGVGDPSIVVDTVTNTIWVAATWSHGNRSWRGS
ncbi:MAG: hypothetical protein HN350_20270, partial [Phycisphaerales bacterium]|nr:hypothetical protein [Phycisphaerales bacterium]